MSFDAIANELLGEPGVDEGTGFGNNPGLRVGGKIFAMEVDGWVSVEPRDDWAALAREAFEFVST